MLTLLIVGCKNVILSKDINYLRGFFQAEA